MGGESIGYEKASHRYTQHALICRIKWEENNYVMGERMRTRNTEGFTINSTNIMAAWDRKNSQPSIQIQ